MTISSNTNELQEGHEEWGQFYGRITRAELSRRKVMRAGTALALLGTGGMAALLEACGGAPASKPAATSGAGSTGAATWAAQTEGVTGDWDSLSP